MRLHNSKGRNLSRLKLRDRVNLPDKKVRAVKLHLQERKREQFHDLPRYQNIKNKAG